jgi:transcription initiation factor TFIIB
MMRLRKWNIRARMHSSFDRNLSQAMSELERLSDKLQIPASVQETAAIVYRRALREGLVRGRSIKALVTASLYAACRLTETPRSLKEVTEASTWDRKEIARCYRLLLRRLRIKPPITGPTNYVSKIASKAGIGQRAQGRAIRILRESEREKLTTGKDPVGLAAAALYIASRLEGEDVTQEDVADAAGVTEVTVRNRYKGLAEGLNLSP